MRRRAAEPALKQLCDLYALHELEADKGFFQEHGRLSGPRCKAITREVNRLCDRGARRGGRARRRVRDPRCVLGAPIGRASQAVSLRPVARVRPGRLTELERCWGAGPRSSRPCSRSSRPRSGIEAGVAAGDLATALAAHAARNSALMLDAQPMLDALSETEAAARAPDAAGRSRAATLRPAWAALSSGLDAERQRRR